MIVYTMPKSRIMSAGTVGTNRRIRVNGPEGGGNKLQGLPPICNMRSPLVPYVRTRADGENRNVVFCINQLSGGVGAKRGQFGPGNRAGVGQTGGCAKKPPRTAWWQDNKAIMAAYDLLSSHFNSLTPPRRLALVGVKETLAGDLGLDAAGQSEMRHYAHDTENLLHATDHYNDLPTQELKDAVDLLNSMKIYAAVPNVEFGGNNGPHQAQRHIVGTVSETSLADLIEAEIGYEHHLSSTHKIWVLGNLYDPYNQHFAVAQGAKIYDPADRNGFWNIVFQYSGVAGPVNAPGYAPLVEPGKAHPQETVGDPGPARYFSIWRNYEVWTADPCACSGVFTPAMVLLGATIVPAACNDPWPKSDVCNPNKTKYWVMFSPTYVESESWTHGDGHHGGGPPWYWIPVTISTTCGNACVTPMDITASGHATIDVTYNGSDWFNSPLRKLIVQLQAGLARRAQHANDYHTPTLNALP